MDNYQRKIEWVKLACILIVKWLSSKICMDDIPVEWAYPETMSAFEKNKAELQSLAKLIVIFKYK